MRRWQACLVLIGTFVSTNIFAQTSNATLGGTVSDATGALIPGVTVTARNVGTGIVNEATTNEAGSYQFPNLQTGTYEASAELPGFQTARYTNVVLGGSQQVRLNFRLAVAATATALEVVAVADTALATTSASIERVMPDIQVRALPTGDRNVLELLRGLAGTGPLESYRHDGVGRNPAEGNFAGGRLMDTNVTRDGFNVSAGRYNQGTFSLTYTSSDLVEEVRITSGTVDAEATRGSGQIAMVTRSGTNDFRGSAFWYNRNSALDAAQWFNNFRGIKADWENRNQFGVRLGGPIIRNKTFFFFLIDEQRWVAKQNVLGTVFTNEARQGVFRYFPGADNENVLQNNPVVDRTGNPVRPARATGDLQSINLFTRDPLRPGNDLTGWIQNQLLGRMPLPNDFTVGDGLNTAGIRFVRRVYGTDHGDGQRYDTNNRDQFNLRLDHNFTSANKFGFVMTYERSLNDSEWQILPQWPNGFPGAQNKHPQVYNFSLVSTPAQNVVNELRVGYRLGSIDVWAPWYVGRRLGDNSTISEKGREVLAILPASNRIPYQVVPEALFPIGYMQFNAGFGTTRGAHSPMLMYGDTISWTQGRHAFKAGVEFRRDRTDGWNDNNMTPYVQLGEGNNPAPVNTVTIPNLTDNNAARARDVLYTLSGSINFVRQGFDMASPTSGLLGYQDGVTLKRRDWRANEVSAFFKDQWKVTPNLTLNAGLLWEWYGVPYESRGLTGRVAGGFQGLCGVGCGDLTRVELVGKNSPQPNQKLYKDDWNNFGPSIGVSWQLPGFGRTTVLRGGYGVSYSGAQIKGAMGSGGLDAGAGTLPGLSGIVGCCGLTYTQRDYWSLANLKLPFAPQFKALAPVTLTEARTLTMNFYEPRRPTPYIQNFNLSIQRELMNNMILDVAYVGSKSTKLYNRLELNYPKIFETEFLEAFNLTRGGGTHPLFDRMLRGLNIPGAGTVNGTTLTGSAALRLYTPTRTLLANGSAGGLANFLNTTTNVTGQGGGFIRNGGLAENFLIFNPQFASVGINGNQTNANYHALQMQLTKRMSHGFTNQTSYTWSKTLGITDDQNDLIVRNQRDPNRDKAVLSFHRTHIFATGGMFELPFGPNRAFLSVAPKWVQRMTEQWQLGGILRWVSGPPLTITAGGLTNIDQFARNTPHIFGELPDGKVTKMSDGSLPTYFPTLRPGSAGSDPGRAVVTSANTLSAAYSLRAVFDGQGNLLFRNPAPGEIGSLGIRTMEGPARLDFDLNLAKRVRIGELRTFELRADIVNVLNHPVFTRPETNINSPSFGRINSALEGRRFTLGARLNF